MTKARLLRYSRQSLQALDQNTQHVFAAAQALVHYPSGAVYSFIPKNACSTMRLSLAIDNGCIAGPDDWAWIHKNNRTFRAGLREIVMAPYAFVILRCPYRRLASVFLDKIVDRRPEFWELRGLEGDALDPETLTFRGFVDALAKPGRLRHNVHWRPQADFLVYDDYDDWFRLEDFGSVPSRLHEKAGLTVVDARSLTRHGQTGLDRLDGHHSDTPIAVLDQHKRAGLIPDPAALYDEALRDRVWRLYREDVALYVARFGGGRLLFPETARRKPPKEQR